MKLPPNWLRLALPVLLAIAVAGFFLFPRGPTYQGKSINFWFKKYCHSLSPVREETLETIAEIGGDAVPYLSRLLKKSDSTIERAYRSVRLKLPDPVQKWLPRPIEPRRLRADAMACLTRLGWSFNTAAGPLIEATRHSDPETRRLAVQALRDFGPRTSAIVDAVLAVAKDTDARIRADAVSMLEEFAGFARDEALFVLFKPAIPALVGALADADWTVRLHAIRALKTLGPRAHEAILPLSLIWQDHVRLQELSFEAAGALLCIDPGLAKSVAPILLQTLSEIKEGTLLPLVLQALPHIGPSATNAIPALIDLLRSQDQRVRVSAIGALGQMGGAARRAIPELISILADSSDWVRMSAATALAQIDPEEKQKLLACWLDMLKSSGAGRTMAMNGLGNMRTEAREAINFLRDALLDPEPFVRLSSGQALRQIDPNEEQNIIPIFSELLGRRDTTRFLDLSLVQSLGDMGPASLPAVPALIAHLKHRDRRTQLASARALLKIDENQKSIVVAFLADYLQRNDYWDREQAAAMLGKLGPAAKPAAPALKAATMDADEKVRASAIEALRNIER